MLYKATRPEFCLTQMLHFTLERLALSLMPTESWSTKNLIASFPMRFWNLWNSQSGHPVSYMHMYCVEE